MRICDPFSLSSLMTANAFVLLVPSSPEVQGFRVNPCDVLLSICMYSSFSAFFPASSLPDLITKVVYVYHFTFS